MAPWTGIALALAEPGDDALRSRLAAYLHPLAGRPLAWHTLRALAGVRPAPARLRLVSDAELPAALFADLPVPVDVVPRDDLASAAEGGGPVLLSAAAAPAVCAGAQALVDGEVGRWLADTDGSCLAAWLSADDAARTLAGGPEAVRALGGELGPANRVTHPDAYAVRSREALARAQAHVRDALVRRLMEGGTTFLLPETVLVDVDVRTGRDTVVYPHVVLEGATTIGDETVVGPGCRIIDSFVGTGAELKGWNYLSHTTLRNRAILEPYVRRGFD